MDSSPRRLPRTRAVDRVDCLRSLAAGRSVIHVGFAGGHEGPTAASDRGPWLHRELAAVASSIIGIDLSDEGVERARLAGYEGYVADCADVDSIRALGVGPADVVIAGEVIEHIEAPGPFLDGLHELCANGGRLAITTPNAASMLNPLAAVARYELINPTHVAMYSWYTLTNLMSRHGWVVEDFKTYHLPALGRRRGRTVPELTAKALAALQRGLAQWWPFVDFGLIAVASPARSG